MPSIKININWWGIALARIYVAFSKMYGWIWSILRVEGSTWRNLWEPLQCKVLGLQNFEMGLFLAVGKTIGAVRISPITQYSYWKNSPPCPHHSPLHNRGLIWFGPLLRGQALATNIIVIISYFIKWVKVEPWAKSHRKKQQISYGGTLLADMEFLILL